METSEGATVSFDSVAFNFLTYEEVREHSFVKLTRIKSSLKQIVHLEILIAQKTAKQVCIQNPGKFQQCQVTDCKENQAIYYGKDSKRRVDIEPEEKQRIPALHTSGVDFNTFWKMQDYLDVSVPIHREAAMHGEVDSLEAPSARVSWIACENGYWIF
ncbi:DNA-directed RNA polymerase [Salix suchowensis]|nr:DNA-directed RNA polymerase [Salix suchowensis]